MTDAIRLVADLSAVVERLERIEQLVAGSSKRELLRAAAAVKLFGGTRAQFYTKVAEGEILQIRYDERSDSLYDPENILAVRAKYRRTKSDHDKTKRRSTRGP